jgi:Leucine-rich repeat (LRR) protein
LRLRSTQVTAAQVAALQKALPNCKIEWDDPAKTPLKKLAYLDPAFQAWVKATQALPAEQQIEAVSKKLIELNPDFDGVLTGMSGKGSPKVEGGVVTELGLAAEQVTDLSPVRALPGLKTLNCSGSTGTRGALADLSPLAGMKLSFLIINSTEVADLSPLAGMPLTRLQCGYTRISDLSPLAGMPLTSFDCHNCGQVSDLSPLKGAPLTGITCSGTRVADLSPLRGMQLKNVDCFQSAVSDLSPLEGMPLTRIQLSATRITKGMDKLRRIPSLTTIAISNPEQLPAGEFWKRYDAGEFGNPAPSPQPSPARGEGEKKKLAYLDPAFQKWVADTQKLPADKQLEAVSKKLMELNPGFDGKMTGIEYSPSPKIANDIVTEVGFNSLQVLDLSPVRALPGLKCLDCSSKGGTSKFSDLSPVRGIPLNYLCFQRSSVVDLSPLAGMPLTTLRCDVTGVADLSPLRGAPLTYLASAATQISDLSPLAGMPLQTLSLSQLVTDLGPLANMPLTSLIIVDNKHLSDLSPLNNCRSLKSLKLFRLPKITADQVAALQKALPNCKIDWDDPAKAGSPAPSEKK